MPTTYHPDDTGGDGFTGNELGTVMPPDSNPVVSESDYSAGNETTVSTDDTNTVTQGGSWPIHRYVATPSETGANITQIDSSVRVIGNGPALASSTLYLYVWNDNTSAWVQQDSAAVTGSAQTLTGSITSNAPDYVNGSNEIHWLIGASDGGAKGSLDVEYTYIEVTEVATAPEINLKGNGVSIVNGDSTPSTADHTDFETAVEGGGTVDRVFTIENTGDAILNLSGTPKVALSGDTSHFSVTVQPAATVATSGSDTFTIQFAPTTTGTFTCTVSIANDDSDENPYTFDITGEGIASSGGPGAMMLALIG